MRAESWVVRDTPIVAISRSAGSVSAITEKLTLELEAVQTELQTLRTELLRKDAALEATREDLESAKDRERLLQTQVSAYQALPTLRVRDTILRIPLIGPTLRAGCRYLAGRLEPDVASHS